MREPVEAEKCFEAQKSSGLYPTLNSIALKAFVDSAPSSPSVNIIGGHPIPLAAQLGMTRIYSLYAFEN